MNIKKQMAIRRNRWDHMTLEQRLQRLQKALDDFLNYVRKRKKRGETLCTRTAITSPH